MARLRELKAAKAQAREQASLLDMERRVATFEAFRSEAKEEFPDADDESLSAMATQRCISNFIVPPTYTYMADCEYCGPVFLDYQPWKELKRCPWCERNTKLEVDMMEWATKRHERRVAFWSAYAALERKHDREIEKVAKGEK